MDRLTGKYLGRTGLVDNLNVQCPKICNQSFCESCPIQKAFDKLAHYEDLEEQGLLLKLPARNVFESSGDAVYYIYDYEIVECINCGISLDCEGVMWITLGCDENIFQYRNMIAGIDTDPTDCCSKTTDVRIDEWGKTVFLTKEEAEAKLKELQEKEI